MRKKIFYAKAPTKLIVGDPMYLENIENGTDRGAEKQLSFIRKRLPKDMTCKITIEEKDEGYTFKTIYVNIMAVKNTIDDETKFRMFYTFENNKWYPKLISQKGDLGCDSASFCIKTNNSYLDFKTGADGYYGSYFIHKNTDAYCVTLALDSDMFDFEDVVNNFKYLFKEEKIGLSI